MPAIPRPGLLDARPQVNAHADPEQERVKSMAPRFENHTCDKVRIRPGATAYPVSHSSFITQKSVPTSMPIQTCLNNNAQRKFKQIERTPDTASGSYGFAHGKCANNDT